MKQQLKRGLFCCFVILTVFTLASCTVLKEEESLWDSAMYIENTELGSGAKSLNVLVNVQDQSVSFVIHTDKETVGEALLEHNLIAGEKGAYGLYVKTVNGITADYDIDQSYWLFTKNDEPMLTGIDGESFSDGGAYELTYTK